MKEFSVLVNVEFWDVRVEAESREEAEMMAQDKIWDVLSGWNVPDNNILSATAEEVDG